MSGLLWISVVALVGVAAVVVVAWAVVRRGSRGAVVSGSRAARTARVGALGSKMSARYLLAKVRGFFAPPARRRALIDEAHLKSAEEVVALMGSMKGAFMKLGQMVSFVSDDVPPEYRSMLQSLQTSAPPMSFALAQKVVEEELGAPLEKLFRDIDPEPLAAASIGQVHRARLRSGEDVVVKVQYPGVDGAIRADLDNVAFLYTALGMANPGMDVRAMTDEVRERLLEELDYEHEARSQQAFADAYAAHGLIHVPRVFFSHSRRRVITSEYVDGHRFDWLLAQPQPFKDRVGEVLWRFVFGSINKLAAFNADPHPGNYVFHDDGRVTFLDFGCMRYFDEERTPRWAGLVRSHLEGDLPTFRRHLVDLGFAKEDARTPTEIWYEYFGYYYEPIRRDEPFVFTSEYCRRSLSLAFDRKSSRYASLFREIDVPRDFVLVNRIQWGLYSILASMGATANWHRIHREYLFGDPPGTDLGRACAGFRLAWRDRSHLPAPALPPSHGESERSSARMLAPP